jgi:hypothetical protein
MKKLYLIFQEALYDFTHWAIQPLKPLLKLNSRMEKVLIPLERIGKEIAYDCKMCGQCILHSTGMVCSMNCPKNLRNGPCGGVRTNGHCEVKPEIKCVWVRAYENAQLMPKYGAEMLWIQPPVKRDLQDSSAWVNMLHGVDQKHAIEWQTPTQQEELENLWRNNA